MKSARFLLVLSLVLSSLPTSAFAQTATTSRITGQVTDAQGAIVGGATVTLTDKSTRAARTVTTNEEGRYVFPSLDPGTYDLTVEIRGFRKSVISNVTAQVSKSINVDVSVQPGGTDEQVTVSAAGGAQLQKDDSSIGNVIDSDRIARLPNADRQATSLIPLQPGITTGGEVTGARADQNTFSLDG